MVCQVVKCENDTLLEEHYALVLIIDRWMNVL